MAMAGIRRRKTWWLYVEAPLMVSFLLAFLNAISGSAIATPSSAIAGNITNLSGIIAVLIGAATISTFVLAYFLSWLVDKLGQRYMHRSPIGVAGNVFQSAGITIGLVGFIGLVALNAASLPSFIMFVVAAALFGAGGQYIGELI